MASPLKTQTSSATGFVAAGHFPIEHPRSLRFLGFVIMISEMCIRIDRNIYSRKERFGGASNIYSNIYEVRLDG